MRRVYQGPLNIGKVIDDAVADAALNAISQVTLTTTAFVTLTTAIPSNAKRIELTLNGISGSGTSDFLIQIGTGGTFATGSYASSFGTVIDSSSGSGAGSTAGYILDNQGAANSHYGHVVLTNPTSTVWISSSQTSIGSTSASSGTGMKDIGGTLDSIRITHANGTDTFDVGGVSILYET